MESRRFPLIALRRLWAGGDGFGGVEEVGVDGVDRGGVCLDVGTLELHGA